jgi:hypothetical protein
MLLHWKFLRLVFVLVAWIVSAKPGQAQAVKPDSVAAAILNSLYGDFDAPDLTAPTLLGVATNQVTKPANTKAFAISLMGAGASYPEVGKGLGIEIAPVQFIQRSLLKGKPDLNRSLKSYAQWQNRLGRSLTISAAQTSTDSSARAAVGGAFLLFDKTDPLLDVIYNTRLARRLTQEEEKADFINGFKEHNRKLALSRDAFINTAGIYPQTGGVYTGSNQDVDKGKLIRFTDLMDADGIGKMPQNLPDDIFKAQTLEKFSAAQDQSLAQLKTSLSTESAFSKSEKALIVKMAEEEVAAAKKAYPDFRIKTQQFYTATEKAVDEERKEFEKRLWNAPIGQVGGGWTWASIDKQYRTLKPQSGSFFARTAFRLHSTVANPYSLTGASRFFYWHTQLVLDLRYSNYRLRDNLIRPSLTLPDSLDQRWWYGARLLVGGAYFRLSGELSWQNLTYSSLAQEAADKAKRALAGTIVSATIGAEVRLVDKVWLEFAIGSAKPTGQAAHLLTLGSLKYAIRNNQRFKTN